MIVFQLFSAPKITDIDQKHQFETQLPSFSFFSKPTIFFTVSGAPAGEKLDGWIADSLPEDLISRMKHIGEDGASSHIGGVVNTTARIQ